MTCEALEPRRLLSIASTAFPLVHEQVQAGRSAFYIYEDADSGLNHGYPSGLFASSGSLIAGTTINASAVYSASSASGTTVDPAALDRDRGTVLEVGFPAITTGQWVGLNIEEPEVYGSNPRGIGYDLRGTTSVLFEGMSPIPGGVFVQVGVGERVTDKTQLFHLTEQFQTFTFQLADLRNADFNNVSPPDLSNVHVLFTVTVANSDTADGTPAPVTILLDNIRFDSLPTSSLQLPGLPLDTRTYGVVPVSEVGVPIAPDQANRNIASTYSSSITLMALLTRGTPGDVAAARRIADALVYALQNDNQGDPIPPSATGAGLHNAYSGGDLPLMNDQGPGQGVKGQVRLSGFMGPTNQFYLVLDGATGGNNAFAILALTMAYSEFEDLKYLDAARSIGHWIIEALTDHAEESYGGYYLGYGDGTFPKTLQTGKSTENNADIFAAFIELAMIESILGNGANAQFWTTAANVAGDFVMEMYDPSLKRFNAGTVPVGTAPTAGIEPSDTLQRGSETVNVWDFLDSNTFTILALAPSDRYRNQIDWRDPLQYTIDHFAQTVSAGGTTFQGFNIVTEPTGTPGDNRPLPGPNGIAWEFTGQMVVTMRIVDALYHESRFGAQADFFLSQIALAQSSAPFNDDGGLVGSTVEGGDLLLPVNQGLTTPFQFIPERVGLPATIWAILAEQQMNPLTPHLPALTNPFGSLPGQILGASAGSTGNINIATQNPLGVPIVLQQAGGATTWTGSDLQAKTGSPDVLGEVVTWVDPKDGRNYAAAMTAEGLVLFTNTGAATWTFRNLSTEIPGLPVITGNLTAFTSIDGLVSIAGVVAGGDLIRYFQTGAGSAAGYAWSAINHGDDLRAQGISMPQFAGRITSFVTSWNALNVVGLDASGQIQAIWWHQSLATDGKWTTNNLSAQTGAPALTGGLTVWLTSWNAINIAGTDVNGKLSATWWVPEFNGNLWNNSNLTDEIGGPLLEASSMTSWVTPWGAMNIAGREADGTVGVYWWVPNYNNNQWNIVHFRDAVPDATLTTGPVTGLTALGGGNSMSILSTSGAGDVMRLWWSPSTNAWAEENLTQTAVAI